MGGPRRTALPKPKGGATGEADEGEDQRRRNGPRAQVDRTVARHWADDVGDGSGEAAEGDHAPKDQDRDGRPELPLLRPENRQIEDAGSDGQAGDELRRRAQDLSYASTEG